MKKILLIITLILIGLFLINYFGNKKQELTEKVESPKIIDTILEERMDSKDFVKFYKNENLGISFLYVGNEKSHIKETDGKLQFIDYYEETGEYNPIDQWYMEIYQKDPKDRFEVTVNKIISEQNLTLDQCVVEISDDDDQQILTIVYKEDFVFDENKCSSYGNERMGCYLEQSERYNELAVANCSSFVSWPYKNHFIYQPQNTKDKIVFQRVVSGLDAPPWDFKTLKLFKTE